MTALLSVGCIADYVAHSRFFFWFWFAGNIAHSRRSLGLNPFWAVHMGAGLLCPDATARPICWFHHFLSSSVPSLYILLAACAIGIGVADSLTHS